MANYAYLRVSTNAQDVENQKHGILEYANAVGIGRLEFYSDEVSGKVRWSERVIGKVLLEVCARGDRLIFSEVSRIGRSTLQVLEVLQLCIDRGIEVHIAKQQMKFDGSMQSRIATTVLGLAAEIEREFISARTKEALARRKAAGMKLGRPKGEARWLKLDHQEAEIKSYLDKGINKSAIAKLCDCSPSTLYHWMKRRSVKIKSA